LFVEEVARLSAAVVEMSRGQRLALLLWTLKFAECFGRKEAL
jgi:hypothetical protein